MKKLLASSAIALIALSGAASAQSVLERVLGQIDNATNLASVNGTFANIAENIGSQTVANVYTVDGAMASLLNGADPANNSVTLSEDEFQNLAALLTGSLQAGITENNDGTFTVSGSAGTISVPSNAFETREAAEAYAALAVDSFLATNSTSEQVVTGFVEGIDGSINNTIDGITDVTQQAIASASVSAIEYNMPTFDFGDMATTALGAVNTGDITLGVNSAVDEAKTSSTNAISAVVNQLGGSADTGAIVLNIASNMTGVNGSINNVMEEVNGSIGNLSTTALGAVNTGTIISGVDAAVAGIVGSSSGGSNGQ
jgi:hypothetical protein